LSDIQPQILSSELRAQLDTSKAKASKRKLIEARIPIQLLFANSGGRQGWPSFQPTIEQCEIVAAVRRDISTLMGPEIQRSANTEILYTTAQAVYERYAQLLSQRETQLTTRTRRLTASTHPALPQLTNRFSQPVLFPN
jgi:hypothetical protein